MLLVVIFFSSFLLLFFFFSSFLSSIRKCIEGGRLSTAKLPPSPALRCGFCSDQSTVSAIRFEPDFRIGVYFVVPRLSRPTAAQSSCSWKHGDVIGQSTLVSPFTLSIFTEQVFVRHASIALCLGTARVVRCC